MLNLLETIEECNKSHERSNQVSDYIYKHQCQMAAELQERRIKSEGLYEEACTRLKDFKVKKHSKEFDTILSIGMLICK